LIVDHGEDGMAVFEERLLKEADELSRELGVKLRLDQNIVREAFAAAWGSVRFHQIPLKRLSHYKELAHLAFWVAELKPITLVPPKSPADLLRWTSLAVSEVFEGNSASYTQASLKFDESQQQYSKHATFPVSEYVALKFLCNLAEQDFLRHIETIKDPDHSETVAKRQNYFKAVLYGGLFENVMSALRFHIFTPRSFATLIDSIFAFEGD
jgi:hypothetical protein